MNKLQAPFPWFGGKSKVAHLVWERFGNVKNYVEPFAGSLAVLLGRPHEPGIETVNDIDGYIANFWRAVQADPNEVAKHADWPVNEVDLHARHLRLVELRDDFTLRLMADPDYYDAQIAGWWCWGICCWIGGNWCSGEGPWSNVDGKLQKANGAGIQRNLPHLGAGRGIQRKLPHLGDAGRGINRQLPHLGAGQGINRQLPQGLESWFGELCGRLRNTRVACGDWSRVCGPSVTHGLGLTGVFLDPPYGDVGRDNRIYASESLTVAAAAAKWARENGNNPNMRIALCGYEEEHEMPDWDCVAWSTLGGYGNRSGNQNKHRERIWFSPHCLSARQLELL